MQKAIVHRVIAILLVLLMCVSLFPTAFASDNTDAEISAEDAATQKDNTVDETERLPAEETVDPAKAAESESEGSSENISEPESETEPSTETEPAKDSELSENNSSEEKSALELYAERLEFLNSQDSALDVEYYLQPSEKAYNEMMAICPMNAGDHKYSNKQIHVVGWIDTYNGFKMPNGSRRYSAYEFALDANGDGVLSQNETAYCMEPYVDVLGGNIYNSTETSAGSNVSSPWGKLSWGQQQAVGLALLYGYPHLITDGDSVKERLCDQLATEIIIHEIVLGWRNPYPPYKCTNKAYINAFTDPDNGGNFSSGIFVENAELQGRWIDYDRVQSTYNRISNGMAKHTIPSFTKGRPQTAPVYTMKPVGNGKYSVTLTDSIGTLPDFRFPNLPGITFKKSGNSVTITADSYDAIPSGVIKAVGKEFPSAEKSAYLIWNGNSNGKHSQDQICLKPGCARTDPVPAYFKLAAPPTGKLEIRKATSDGKNLAGWKIGVYKDPACKNPIKGSPFTTPASGVIIVEDLNPGTYYVREVDESASKPGWKFDTSRHDIVISAGESASVKITNTILGRITVKKCAVNGSPEGWTFEIRNRSNKLVDTIETGADGIAVSKYLEPGVYTVREIHDRDTTYWTYDSQSDKGVTVVGGADNTVCYTNTLYGRLKIIKCTNTGGNRNGWVFDVKDSSGRLVDVLTTGADGTAVSGKLAPGVYTVTERRTNNFYWKCDVTPHKMTVQAGSTVSDKWTNTLRGRIVVRKNAVNGSPEGWSFGIYDSRHRLVQTVTTGENGTAVSKYLEPGTYSVREIHDRDDTYWTYDSDVQKGVIVKGGSDATVTYTNEQFGRVKILKSMATDGPLDGWKFKVTDSDGNEIDGSPFTSGTDGSITTGKLKPGKYTIEELIPEDSLYYCKSENPQTITVEAGETASVSFTNALRPGSVAVKKVDTQGNTLAGAKFCLEWSKDGKQWNPVRFSDSEDVILGGCSNQMVENGCLITQEDGLVKWENLYPGIYYRLTEVEAPDGYQLLSGTAWKGELPVEDLTVELRVVNSPVLTLPQTGSNALTIACIAWGVALAICCCAVYCLKKIK